MVRQQLSNTAEFEYTHATGLATGNLERAALSKNLLIRHLGELHPDRPPAGHGGRRLNLSQELPPFMAPLGHLDTFGLEKPNMADKKDKEVLGPAILPQLRPRSRE